MTMELNQHFSDSVTKETESDNGGNYGNISNTTL